MHTTTLGERIKLARTRRGLSQEALGDAVGASRNTVMAWEKDAAQPEGRYVTKLLETLDVDANWLFLNRYREGGVTLPEPEVLEGLRVWLNDVLSTSSASGAAPVSGLTSEQMAELLRERRWQVLPPPDWKEGGGGGGGD